MSGKSQQSDPRKKNSGSVNTISIDSPKNIQEAKSGKLVTIANALARVDQEINDGIWSMAHGLREADIISLFNQNARDFFNYAIEGTKKMNQEREYGFSGYLSLFERAMSINVGLPIDQFTIIVLEFAPEIYDTKENFFLNMNIPDTTLESENEFNIIRSEKFKKLWKMIQPDEKEGVKKLVISLTTYAHAYFYKLLLNKQQS
jgi:hypothetical protein